MYHVYTTLPGKSITFVSSSILGGSSIAVMPDPLQYFLGPRSFHDSQFRHQQCAEYISFLNSVGDPTLPWLRALVERHEPEAKFVA